MVCTSNLKPNLERVLSTRSHIPKILLPTNLDAITVSNITGDSFKTQVARSKVSLFSGAANFSDTTNTALPIPPEPSRSTNRSSQNASTKPTIEQFFKPNLQCMSLVFCFFSVLILTL